MPIKVIIVEADNYLRASIVALIKNDEDIELAEEYGNTEDFINSFSNLKPDIMIMDINLPELSFIQRVLLGRKKKSKLQYLMCSLYEDKEKIVDSLYLGATSYILKKSSPKEIVAAVKDLYNGGSSMSGIIARKVIYSIQYKKNISKEYQGLSEREKGILEYLVKGFRYKEIADDLNISVETVRTHIRNIYQKLQVQSRTAALNKLFPEKWHK